MKLNINDIITIEDGSQYAFVVEIIHNSKTYGYFVKIDADENYLDDYEIFVLEHNENEDTVIKTFKNDELYAELHEIFMEEFDRILEEE